MKKTNRIMSMLLAVIMVVCMLPVSVFAADAATIVVNSKVIRYSETKAEVSFYPTSYDSQLDWQYYYIVTEQDAEKTADDVKNSGTAHEFDEEVSVATFDVTNLASGVSYIHIVLVQKDNAEQVSNVLTLEIPEYVPLTITPSAENGEYDAETNTLTVEVGTTVTFTTSEIGCGMEYKEDSKVGPDLVGEEGYSRTATFTEVGTYTIVASIDYKTAECTVVVVDELHQHKYFSSWSKDASGHWHDCDCGATTDYAEHTSSGAATEEKAEVCTVCGYEMAPKLPTYTLTLNYNEDSTGVSVEPGSKTIIGLTSGEVVDLSKHWPANKTVNVGGTTYYFAGFEQNKGDTKVESPTVTVNSDLTLDANWTTTPMVSLTFETNNGTMPYAKVREKMYRQVGNVNSIHIPVRSGYTFLGWSVWPEGPADRPDRIIKNDCTLYAIWAEGIVISGYEDAVLVDKNGTIEKVEDGYTAIFNDSKVDMNNSAWQSLIDQLQDGEQLKIATEKLDVTERKDDEVLFDSGILIGGAGIFTEEELLDLGVISTDNNEITWNELKYLYHYMTITDMKSLGWFIEDFLYNTDPQVLVWLDEMIERDTIKPLNMQELMDMADLTDDQFELLADADLNDPPIGHLRQAGFTVEQMRRLYSEVSLLIGNLNDSDRFSNCNELLGWLDDAIAAKEWEADKSQTQPIWAYTARETVIGAVNINFDAVKVNGTTNAVTEVRPITASGELAYTIPVNSNFDLSKGTVRAYKVADDGSLNIKKVVVNADGTVTIQSDSNSTYIVTYEPAKADIDDTPTTPEVPSSPQTGDNSHMWLWVALLFVSGAGLVGTTLYSRKRKTN